MAFTYSMSPIGKAFHESDAFVKMILGPYGSGKSCCCAVDVLTNACAQYAASDGVRYCRVGVVRSSYPELGSMTRRSLLEVLPAQCGTITSAGAPLRGFYLIPLMDGTKLHLELELFALQTSYDCEKIKSSNWTFAFINEATGICSEVFAMILSRVGRYPSLDLGGVRYGGVLMDFNMPEAGSWLDVLIKDLPEGYALFKQPPAAFQHEDAQGKKFYTVNADAENLRNLGSREEGDPEEFASIEEHEAYLVQKGMRYYRKQIDTYARNGRDDVIMNQFCMLDVPIVDGKPVYTAFSRTRHVAHDVIAPVMFANILLGVDQSGIHPAGVVMQYQQGKWCVLDEMYADGEGFENFLHGVLVPLLRSKYATNPVIAGMDPSNQRDSWQAVTPKQRMEDIGILAVTEFSNSPKVRIQMVEQMLNLEVGGLLVSPNCENLLRGFTSEYRYRKLRTSGSIGAAYTPVPEKNEFSHCQDALQYAAMLIHRQRSIDTQYTERARELSRKREILSRMI